MTMSALLTSLAGAGQARTQSVEVVGSPLRPVMASEADELKGLHFMSDGRRMQLNFRRGAIVAFLDGEPVTELHAVSARQLRSADGRMLMRFEVDRWLGRNDVTVTQLKGETVAQLTSTAIKR